MSSKVWKTPQSTTPTEAMAEAVEGQHVADLEVRPQPTPAGFGLCPLDGSWRYVNACYIETARGEHQRVLARATSAIENRRRELATLRELDESRLRSADIPWRPSVGVCAVPVHDPMVRAIVVILLLVPMSSDFDFEPIEVLTFDCYGTLIDWESGLLAGLRAVVGSQGTSDELLESYGRAEAQAEAGDWLPYRHVLQAGDWRRSAPSAG